jgi:hypothetical protein
MIDAITPEAIAAVEPVLSGGNTSGVDFRR